MKTFNYFENHGNEEGTDNFTIIYGEVDDLDHIIIGAEDDEQRAKESCMRLNEISCIIAESAFEFLEREGYTDSDWRDEEPTALKRFLNQKQDDKEDFIDMITFKTPAKEAAEFLMREGFTIQDQDELQNERRNRLAFFETKGIKVLIDNEKKLIEYGDLVLEEMKRQLA